LVSAGFGLIFVPEIPIDVGLLVADILGLENLFDHALWPGELFPKYRLVLEACSWHFMIDAGG